MNPLVFPSLSGVAPMAFEPHALTALALSIAATMVGGVFQAFSDFVMAGFRAAQPAIGAQAMVSVNRTVMRSVFLLMLLALGPATIGFAAWTVLTEGRARALLAVSAAAIYGAGVLWVTIAKNVPMNEHLRSLAETGADLAPYWRLYAARWTRWNHVRTLSALSAGSGLGLTALL